MKFLLIIAIIGVNDVLVASVDWNKVNLIENSVVISVPPSTNDTKINRDTISGRVYNGYLVSNMIEIPYQAGLLLEKDNGEQFWCGGSIISNRCILSAAHCFQNVANGTIYLGTKNNDYLDRTAQLIDFNRNNIITHRNFNPRNFRDDIAVVCVRPFQLSADVIEPIRIIKRIDENIDNQLAMASGWGHVKDSDDSAGERLRFTTHTVMTNSKCDAQLNSVYKREPYETENLICTNSPTISGNCKGDSGGPLAAKINGEKTLIGVFSFVTYSREDRSNCERPTARVFQRLSNYRTWICINANVCS